ncbi:MAG TPA: amidohydrolase family protein [Kineosporiaceae bacterium]|jgi:N-acyl-D-aspartate/D-glutamate deacylase|nr:amidohydrolase family protein [Kineosporiaceae bacterium]
MHELVLRGGRVHDGLGGAAAAADVAISGGRVTAVGPDLGAARRVVDVAGLDVAPGFVDAHAHSDLVPFAGPSPFKLLQGVTTEVAGNCGYSPAPLDGASAPEADAQIGEALGARVLRAWTFAEYLAQLQAARPVNHLAVMVGHNTLRLVANGMDRELRPGALDRMRALAEEAFAAGAAGLSSGLIYVPGAYGGTDELVALARVAHRYGVPYATHLRDEGDHLEAALDEAVEVARRARVRLQVSHCKAAGHRNHGKGAVLLERLARARREGVDARGDQYPYDAGGTMLSALLPTAAYEGGTQELVRRLQDAGELARLRAVAQDPAAPPGSGLWSSAAPGDVLVTAHRDRGTVGRTLAEIADGEDPWVVLARLLVADPAAMMVVRLMADADIRAIMADPLVGVGSDNGSPSGFEHPRTWGCFPHFLGTWVRDAAVVPWEEAVRKATSAVADQFGLLDRGWLGAGAHADVTIFDRARIGHPADYARPSARPTGIEWVLVGGEVAVERGEYTGLRTGRVLRPWTR